MPEVRITGAKEQFAIKARQILLTCQYNALPPVSEVLWEKDGSVIARNTTIEINGTRVTVAIPHYNQSHVQLAVHATTPHYAGNYTCIVLMMLVILQIPNQLLGKVCFAGVLY